MHNKHREESKIVVKAHERQLEKLEETMDQMSARLHFEKLKRDKEEEEKRKHSLHTHK